MSATLHQTLSSTCVRNQSLTLVESITVISNIKNCLLFVLIGNFVKIFIIKEAFEGLFVL